MAYTPENNPYIPGDPYCYDLKWQVDHIKMLQGRVDDLDNAIQEATDQADRSEREADRSKEEADRASQKANMSEDFSEYSYRQGLKSEGYAAGQQNGENVEPGSPYYENNSKYYSQRSAASAQDAADYAAHIADPVSGLVTQWLITHVNPDTGYVIDDTLTIQNAAADAKAAGDRLTAVENNVLVDCEFIKHDGGYIAAATGAVNTSNPDTSYTNFIDVSKFDWIEAPFGSGNNPYQMAFYNITENLNIGYLSGVSVSQPSGTVWHITVPTGAIYARLSYYTVDGDDYYVKGHCKKLADNVTDIEYELSHIKAITKDFEFDKIEGGYIKWDTGYVYPDVDSGYTNYIDVSGCEYVWMNITKKSTYQMAFYGDDMIYIDGYINDWALVGDIWTIKVPTGTKYARFSYHVGYDNGLYIKGYTTNICDLVTNLQNKYIENCTFLTYDGYYIQSTNGELGSNENVTSSSFINVERYSDIILRVTRAATFQLAFYDSNKKYVSGSYNPAPYTSAAHYDLVISVPSNAKYVRVCYYTAEQDEFYCKGIIKLNTLKPLKGKKLSIVGDSISTYSGYLPGGYAAFYPRSTVNEPLRTWWMQLIAETEMELCANASWSGSTICGDTTRADGYVGCSDARISAVADGANVPDIIIVWIGINDFGKVNGFTCGSYEGKTAVSTLTTITNITDAYGVLLSKLATTYPKAKIFVCTLMPERFASEMAPSYANGFPDINPDDNMSLPELNEKIKKIAAAFGCTVIPMDETGVTYYNLEEYTIDNLHPDFRLTPKMAEMAKHTIEAAYC